MSAIHFSQIFKEANLNLAKSRRWIAISGEKNILHVEIEPLLIKKYVNRSLNEISRKWTDVNWR
ncbi:MAG: hypothetical protein QXG01_05820 [Candidatus Bathyarchaeia archaeon]